MSVKYIFIITCVFISSLCACNNSHKKKIEVKNKDTKSLQITSIKASKNLHDFGKIKEGEILVCNFYIENVGEDNLIINSVESSCGCTIAKWNKEPLEPGKKTKIEVEFNSSGRYGKQYKVISIFANVPNKVYELIITAEVN